MRRWLAGLIACVCVLPACGPVSENAPSQTPMHEAQVPTPSEEIDVLWGRVRAVNLDGEPLAGMIPIATRSANAFDPPVARGGATGEGGSSRVALPPQEHLFVRAWDPDKVYFATNVFEVWPSFGTHTEEMQMVMARGASVEATLLLADGDPAGRVSVDLTMIHPVKGPWWPAHAVTDAKGRLTIASVPPGTYLLSIDAGAVGKIDLGETEFAPGGHTNLGPVTLR